MIFKQVDEIREGRKTETRRIAKSDEIFADSPFKSDKDGEPIFLTPGVYLAKNYDELDGLWESARLKWGVGKTYAVVPKRGQPAIKDGRIGVLGICREHLQDITEEGARAEGVSSIAAYHDLWESINGKTKGARWDDNPEVWVIKFKFLAFK